MKRSATVALALAMGLAGCASDQRLAVEAGPVPGTTLTAQLIKPQKMTDHELDQVSGGFFFLGGISTLIGGAAGYAAGDLLTRDTGTLNGGLRR